MDERLLDSDPGDDPRAHADPGSPPGTPRWIAPLAIAVAVLLVGTVVVLHLTGAIGPGVH